MVLISLALPFKSQMHCSYSPNGYRRMAGWLGNWFVSRTCKFSIATQNMDRRRRGVIGGGRMWGNCAGRVVDGNVSYSCRVRGCWWVVGSVLRVFLWVRMAVECPSQQVIYNCDNSFSSVCSSSRCCSHWLLLGWPVVAGPAEWDSRRFNVLLVSRFVMRSKSRLD